MRNMFIVLGVGLLCSTLSFAAEGECGTKGSLQERIYECAKLPDSTQVYIYRGPWGFDGSKYFPQSLFISRDDCESCTGSRFTWELVSRIYSTEKGAFFDTWRDALTGIIWSSPSDEVAGDEIMTNAYPRKFKSDLCSKFPRIPGATEFKLPTVDVRFEAAWHGAREVLGVSKFWASEGRRTVDGEDIAVLYDSGANNFGWAETFYNPSFLTELSRGIIKCIARQEK